MLDKQPTKSSTSVGVGASSVLVIFVVLSLVTFAVLSFTSAKADKNLSNKTLQHMQEYYACEAVAYQQLKDIDIILADTYKTDPLNYLQNVKSKLSSLDNSEVTENDGVLYVSFVNKITSEQSLHSQIKVLAPTTKQDVFYKITKWQTVNDINWNPDEKIPVYK